MEHIKYIIAFLLLLIAIEDIKYLSVNIISLFLLIFFGCFGSNLLVALFVFMILTLLWLFIPRFQNGFGFADIVAIACSCSFLENENIPIFFILIGASSSIFMIVFRKFIIAFLPFVFISFSFLLLFQSNQFTCVNKFVSFINYAPFNIFYI